MQLSFWYIFNVEQHHGLRAKKKCSLAFVFMAITNEVSKVGTWNLL
jgi:hypothetical protein